MKRLLTAALAASILLAPAAPAARFNRSVANWQRIAATKKKITIPPTGPTGFAVHWDQAAMWFGLIPGTATYTNIHISGDPSPTGIYTANGFGLDLNYEVTATNSDPTKNIVLPTDWAHRVCTTGCTTAPGGTGVHIPANINATTLPGIADPNGSSDTPNNPAIIYNATTGATWYLNAFTRPTSTSDAYGYTSDTGTHGGSQTSGGYISLAELTAGNIPHAIGVVIDAQKYMTTTGHGTGKGTGIFAPALTVDSYFPSNYGGTDTTFGMGSRLAIPAATTCSSLGAGSGDALTICNMMKKYGVIVVDDSGWDFAYIQANQDAESRLSGLSGTTVINLFAALQHVRGVITGD